ncbi:hypothetical protein [Rhizohabitans arisaemae]|uniref:hypothetical protein n=1 Tax=Rhizohabitans arisaemae TaxID=2720610 RepID=UPI0024B1C19D|nr:hypothetical protein [Rhizohabitans arisaemae]
MICPRCHGSGHVVIGRMAIVERQIVTAGVEEMCKACGGRRYLACSVFSVDEIDPG